MSFLDWALRYYDAGWNIFPLDQQSKKPPDGFLWKQLQYQRLSREKIGGWWTLHPDSNIALITGGVSKVTVIDLDWAKNEQAIKDPSISVPIDKLASHLPMTLTVRTGSGGIHRFFNFCAALPCSTGKIHRQVDVKSEGGYVVLPPSIHPDTKTEYAWITPFEETSLLNLADIPPKILELDKQNNKRASRFPEVVRGVGAGQRNVGAAVFIGKMLWTLDPMVTWDLAKLWNKTCKPPLGETELWAIFQSIYSRHAKYAQRNSSR